METHGKQVDPLKKVDDPELVAPVARDAQIDASPRQEEDEALGIAWHYQGERDTRLGIVSRAFLKAREERPELFGLLIRPSHWLEDTCAVQRNAYDLEPEGVEYVKEQAFAAIVELAELVQSIPWKAARDGLTGEPVEMTASEKEHARGEVVDAIIFTGNIAVALEFDDRTLWQEINQKAMRNVAKRQGLGKEVWK